MTPVIGFVTSILFCSICDECSGWIECPWLSPHDEANCLQQCSSSYYPIPCVCNKLGNMTCAVEGGVCYSASGKLLVLFYFCKRHND